MKGLPAVFQLWLSPFESARMKRMPSSAPSFLVSALASLLALTLVILWRRREGSRPVSLRTILMPPIGMSTGLVLFLVPECRVPWPWAVAAFLTGALLLAWPLLKTTRLHFDGERVTMQRSKAFLGVIVALALIRFLARSYLDQVISVHQSAALFFLLAYGMILRWRVWMFAEYRHLTEPAVEA